MSGKAGRDAGISQAVERERLEWRMLHDRELHTWLLQKRVAAETFLPEDFRKHLLELVKPPHHPNVWGAMWMAAVKRGWVKRTGQYRQMKDPSSHARVTAEWEAGNL